jgi:hypothetical protein
MIGVNDFRLNQSRFPPQEMTPTEAAEPDQLQREIAHRRRLPPLPLDNARKLHQQLLAKAEQAHANSCQ